MTTTDKLRIGILGASGYTGVELLRLLAGHPHARIELLTAERHAGKEPAEVFTHLGGMALPRLSWLEEGNVGELDVLFACLPHGTTQEVIRDLPRGPRVIDLSA